MPNTITKKSKSGFSFFGDIISELKKVVWLSRREAMYLTAMVLIVAVSVGVILGALDFGFSKIIEFISD